jgi:hypothetical protein
MCLIGAEGKKNRISFCPGMNIGGNFRPAQFLERLNAVSAITKEVLFAARKYLYVGKYFLVLHGVGILDDHILIYFFPWMHFRVNHDVGDLNRRCFHGGFPFLLLVHGANYCSKREAFTFKDARTYLQRWNGYL